LLGADPCAARDAGGSAERVDDADKPAVEAPVFVTVIVHVTVLQFAQSRVAADGAVT
jgi:hypothetical protein